MVKHEFRFSNGDKVEDIVTGFKGIVTGSAYYLTGCNQYCVAAKAKDEFTEATVTWYDEGRLNLMTEKVVTEAEVKAEKNGADKSPSKSM
jgi:hypothetical protein